MALVKVETALEDQHALTTPGAERQTAAVTGH